MQNQVGCCVVAELKIWCLNLFKKAHQAQNVGRLNSWKIGYPKSRRLKFSVTIAQQKSSFSGLGFYSVDLCRLPVTATTVSDRTDALATNGLNVFVSNRLYQATACWCNLL
jgi:hypothetical protein